MRNEKPPTRQLQARINLNYRPLSRLSMDLKVMPRSGKGHKFILCIIDECNKLFDYSTNISVKSGRGRRSFNRTCYN